MKKILNYMFASVLAVGALTLASCGGDDGPKVDAPVIVVTGVDAGGSVAFAPGLGILTVNITGTDLVSLDVDIAGTVTTANLSGDEAVVDVSLTSLESGTYAVTLTASDDSGNETTFSLSVSVYTANESAIYIRGGMNEWGTTALTLVGNNTWSVSGVALTTDATEYKFANTDDWSDVDWGDATGLSGTMSVTSGGGTNASVTAAAAGNFTFTFNDDDLSFSIVAE